MPDVSLNGIEFQIKGNSDKASNSIDSLIKNLNSLKSALAATNSAAKGTGTFKELAVSIKDFNDALKGGSERYKKFAQGLEDIAAAAELLGEKTQHISDLATSMEKLSNSKISGAAFKNLADGMAAVGFATKFISKEALDNLERMATSLSKLAGVDLKGLGSAMNAVGRGKTLEPPSPVPSEIQDVINSGDQIDLLRLKLGELQTALQSAFEKGDLTGAIRIRQQIASVEAEIRKLEEAANEVVPTMGRFREALSSIGSFLGKYAGTAEKVFSAFGKVLAFPFTRAAKDIGGYAKSIWGVVSGFKRIVGYRLIRSIIREVTQAFSEGIKNLYGWSKAMGGATISGKNFAQTMDGLATSSLYFKNSIGAMVAPIISALAPAIDYIIDKVVALINVINQLFALLGGATSWNKAIRKATEFEDAAGGAGGAAKEALRYLAPFDELNRLPDDNKGGGGGGGTDYSGMFEEQTEFLEGLKDFADSVRAAIDAGDWEGLGVLLGDKVNELIEKIDFEAIGSKVGESINALFTTRYWTLKAINFQTIGAKIAEFLNSALGNIDFETIGRSFAQKFTILPDLIIGFLGEADWKLIGTSIGNYIRGVFDEWSEWLSGVNWEQLGYNIAVYIGQAIDGLDTNSLARSIKTFLTKAVSAALSLLEGFAKALFNGGTFNTETTVSVNAGISNFDMFDETGRGEAAWHNALVSALPTLVAALGFKVGGIKGAAFGLTIGLGLKGVIEIVQFFEGGKTDTDTLIHGIVDVLPTLGGVIGFVVGGPGGAAVGVVIGFGIKGFIDGFEAELGDLSLSDVLASLGHALQGLLTGLSLTPVGSQILAKLSLPVNLVMTIGSFLFGGGDGEDGGHTTGSWDDAYAPVKDGIEEAAANNPIEIPVKPGLSAGGFSAKDFLGDKDSIDLPATADFRGWSVYGTKNSETVKSFTTWDSTANWKDWKVYGSKSSSNVNSFTTWSSTANWNRQTIGKSWGGTTWDSTANFTKYIIKPSLQASDGSLKVNGTFNIVKLTGNTNIDQVKAGGGVYTSGGWKPVQSFAGGGSPFGGQIFRARENGNPELVGTLRGSTAVMNNDQIVASVSSGVARAIAGIHFQMTGLSASAPAMEESANEDTMYRAFRRALDETDFGKDISIDGEPIYQSVVRRNRQNTRATGVNQLAMA